MMYDGSGWGFMVFMPLIWIVLLGAIIWLVVRLAQPSRDVRAMPGPDGSSKETPRDILDRRYASGELDAEAYVVARDHLKGT
jgi:putative membrane protein